MMGEIYHVVRKNVEGAYLLDSRNDSIYSGAVETDAFSAFNNCVANKQKNEHYTLFIEVKGCKRLAFLREV